jgi:hypothetical protein
MVQHYILSAEKGMNQFPVSLELNAGEYLVVVRSSNQIIQRKLIIE